MADSAVESLSKLIVSGNEAEARRVVAERPSALCERSSDGDGWYPADWAIRSGRVGLYAFLLRHGAPALTPTPETADLLRDYVREICETRFAASHLEGIERSIWEQLRGERSVFFDGQEPQFGLSSDELADLRWLLDRCEVTSIEQLKCIVAPESA